MRSAAWSDLAPGTLHDIVRLRVDIFVVEQCCPYPELDGRDVEPSTKHVWCADSRGVTSYLRVLSEPDGALRIGRVCTRSDVRGQGLSAALLRSVLDRVDAGAAEFGGGGSGRAVVLDAQAHLHTFYALFGFVQDGPGFIEDGIPHVPMRRPASASAATAPATTAPATTAPAATAPAATTHQQETS